MAQKFLSIKNLEKYQTNRKTAPPWFKIHRLMFGDPEFIKLTPAQRFLYIGLIHLAVESGNKIYNDSTFIGQRLYISHTEVDLKPLYRAGFLYTTNLSRVLSEGEREGERERETEGEESREETALASQPLIKVIVDLWNEIPGVIKSKAVIGPIRKRLVSRINEHPDLVWWTTYFDKIKDSAFLTGRKTDFAASLDWVLGPKNMAKILAGNYEDREPVIKESAMLEQARAFLGRG